MKSIILSVAIAFHLMAPPAPAADRRAEVTARVDAHASRFGVISRLIWEYAEPGYRETKSAALLKEELRKEGFRIRDGVAGIPTAFVAEWGSGKPVVGFMGEYDALPGIVAGSGAGPEGARPRRIRPGLRPQPARRRVGARGGGRERNPRKR